MKNRNDDIDVKNIFFYCISKWYFFVLIAVFAVVFVFLSGNISGEENEDTVSEEAVQEYERVEEYLEDSIKMNIDPTNVYKESLVYDFVIEEPLENEWEYKKMTVGQYEGFIGSGKLAEQVAETVSVDKQYIYEIVSIANHGTWFSVYVRTGDGARGQEIAAVVDKTIRDYEEKVAQTYPCCQLKLLEWNSSKEMDLDLSHEQDQVSTYLEALKKEIESASASQAGQGGYTEMIKKVVLLTGGGWVLLVAVLLIIYLYGGRIQESSEMVLPYALHVIGTYVVKSGKGGIFRRLRYSNVISVEEQKCAELLAIQAVSQCPGQKIYFISASPDETVREILKLTTEKCQAKGIGAEYLEEIQKQPEAVGKIMETLDYQIILVEKIGVSRRNAVRAEMELCKNCKIAAEKAIFLY